MTTEFKLSDVLREQALKRAAKQFPEMDPEKVVQAIEQQRADLIRSARSGGIRNDKI